MNSVFAFRGDVVDGADRFETLFLFLPSADIQVLVVEDALKTCIAENRVSPDLVIYIAPARDFTKAQQLLNDILLVERHRQLRRCKGAGLCCYGSDGVPQAITWLPVPGGQPPIQSENLLSAARTAGLGLLSERDGVVTPAPPGAYFRNPSSGRRSYFIRAGLMCRSSVEASFVALALLPAVARAKQLYSDELNVIWVDTVSIAYLAYALIDVGIYCGALRARPDVRSFSSYGGYKTAAPGSNQNPLYLISASTSGGLAQDLVATSQGRIDSRSISTVIGAYDADYPDVIYHLPTKRRGKALDPRGTLREIVVTGEDFLFSPGEAKAVVLKRTQAPEGFAKAFAQIQGKQFVHYFKRANGNRPSKALLVDDRALVSDSKFQEWVRKKAEGTMPLAVKYIIYQNDDASKQMAELVAGTISPHRTAPQPQTLSGTQLEEMPPDPKATVAVVAAVAGSGMELMRVAKALRAFQPEGSRYFLVGIAAARSYSQLSQLRSNLTLSDEQGKFSLECWGTFAPGSEAIHQFRNAEIDWLGQCAARAEATADNPLRQFAKVRLDELKNDGMVHPGAQPVCPFVTMSSDPKAFDIGSGFALWSPFQNHSCPSDVLFSVACWLQNARESASVAPEDRLDSDGFQQTVIAPDSFLRFTDPVIQASIVRAARDSELDYRASALMSARAREIIGKLIFLNEASSLEFLMALTFGRIQLCTDDLRTVVEIARDRHNEDTRVRLLLEIIDRSQLN